jgi:hypothetical protein
MSVDYTTGEIHAPNTGPLTAALAKAQTAFPTVTRSKTVTVTTKTGGSYKFSYAPLDTILDAVRKPLADNGLAVVQLIDRGDLVTILLHESGGSLEGRTEIPATPDVQGLGSAITYLRRYAIQALLGIAAEEDDDGNSASGNSAKPATKAAEAPRTAPEPRKPEVAATDTPDLSDDDWAGLIDSTPAAKPTALTGDGLSWKALAGKLNEAGIDLKDASSVSKRMFGQSKWKVADLTDEERAMLWHELEPVAA